MEYDFSGWATKANVKCADNRVIMPNAFAINDGQTVPLVWNHSHDTPNNVLGHALLKNTDDGVYAYCKLNDTEAGKATKEIVKNGDVKALSIYANNLAQKGNNVVHGCIREVSVVIGGANPQALINNILCHSDDGEPYELEDEAILYFDNELSFTHGDTDTGSKEGQNGSEGASKTEPSKSEEKAKDGKTIKDVLDTFTKEQKDVLYYMIAQTLENPQATNSKNDEGEDNNMKHNVFEKEENSGNVLMHSEEMTAAIQDMKRYGSLKESMLQHGIDNIEYLFPDDQQAIPLQYIQRDMGWVSTVMSSVHRSPFSRVKSVFANITEDEARAKGYIKGKFKKEEVFSLLKRTTTPTTVYKKQKFDRDDLVDLDGADTIIDIRKEMRVMLNEEIGRAILVGDGRLASSDDKINELNIRPIWTDDALYTIRTSIANDPDYMVRADRFIEAAIRSRKKYTGSGSPTLFADEDIITDCLLLKDKNGRRIYNGISELATAMRVKDIIGVPVFSGLTRTDTSDGKEHTLFGIIVNLADYNVGADKGGAVNFFDDFDIDYNAQKYLIETRCSGALVRPYSAIAIEGVEGTVSNT